jgi:nucleotide-binding universal stress UspA family protein
MVIVAAVDRSDRASAVVREAATLAGHVGTDLHVVHVLDQTTFIELERTTVSESGRPVGMDEVRSTAATIAAEAAEGITEEFEAVGLVGNVAGQLVDYADRNDAHYLVIAGRKRSPVEKLLLGSIAQKVLLNATRPVVMIHSDEAGDADV